MAAYDENVDLIRKLLGKDGPAERLFRELVAKYGAPHISDVGGVPSSADLLHADWRVIGEQERLYQMMPLDYDKVHFPGSIGMHRAPEHHRLGLWLDRPTGNDDRPPIVELIAGCRWRRNEYHAGIYIVTPSNDAVPASGYMKMAVPVMNDFLTRAAALEEADKSRRLYASDVGRTCQFR